MGVKRADRGDWGSKGQTYTSFTGTYCGGMALRALVFDGLVVT